MAAGASLSVSVGSPRVLSCLRRLRRPVRMRPVTGEPISGSVSAPACLLILERVVKPDRGIGAEPIGQLVIAVENRRRSDHQRWRVHWPTPVPDRRGSHMPGQPRLPRSVSSRTASIRRTGARSPQSRLPPAIPALRLLGARARAGLAEATESRTSRLILVHAMIAPRAHTIPIMMRLNAENSRTVSTRSPLRLHRRAESGYEHGKSQTRACSAVVLCAPR